MNIHRKIAEVKHQFHEMKLEKTGHNKFAGYKYFELADFLIPALKLMHEHGLGEVTSFTEDVATMTIFDLDKPEDYVVITSPFSSANLKACHAVQNVGACETYQRRYLWTTFLQIVEHDAIDSSPAPEPPPQPRTTRPAGKPLSERVAAACAAYSDCQTVSRLEQLDAHIDSLVVLCDAKQTAEITAAREAAVTRINEESLPNL